MTPPTGELVVSYGGGVNSAAMLAAFWKAGLKPRAITMADPGSERAGTIEFRDKVASPWCEKVGFPPIVLLERRLVGIGRPRTWRLETLRDECLRIKSLPSIAYGWKKCSAKYKAEPQRWWLEKQQWAQALWAQDPPGRIVRCIGYDIGEKRRVDKGDKKGEWVPEEQMARFTDWYPLYEMGLDRAACVKLCEEVFGSAPPKSACTFCPANKLEEWRELRRTEPEKFAEAVAMSQNAELDAPGTVGLMRCNPHGSRQLHIWAAGGYPEIPLEGDDDDDDDEGGMPCECAT